MGNFRAGGRSIWLKKEERPSAVTLASESDLPNQPGEYDSKPPNDRRGKLKELHIEQDGDCIDDKAGKEPKDGSLC